MGSKHIGNFLSEIIVPLCCFPDVGPAMSSSSATNGVPLQFLWLTGAHPPTTFQMNPSIWRGAMLQSKDNQGGGTEEKAITEVCHIAHFGECYGRCTMHGLPMG